MGVQGGPQASAQSQFLPHVSHGSLCSGGPKGCWPPFLTFKWGPFNYCPVQGFVFPGGPGAWPLCCGLQHSLLQNRYRQGGFAPRFAPVVIQRLGQWWSGAFRYYIRVTPDKASAFSGPAATSGSGLLWLVPPEGRWLCFGGSPCRLPCII